MRSRACCSIESGEVHRWALEWLMQAKLVRDHGWKWTAVVVLNVLLRASGPIDLGFRRLPRLGQCALGPGGDDRLGGRLAQNAFRAGMALEPGAGRLFAAALEQALVAGGDRLAFDAVLRRASPEPQRTVLRQAPPGDEAVSRLCVGLHSRSRPAVHAGFELGASARIERRGAAALAGQNSPIGPENQVRFVGSGVLQRVGGGVPPAAAAAVLDAGRDARAETQETSPSDRVALDQAAGRRLIPAHDEKRQTPSHRVGVRRLPHAQEPQRRQAGPAEAVVRRLAGEGIAYRDARALPQAIRHRNQLPATAAGTDLHLHTPTSLAVAVRRGGVGAPQPVGLDPPHAAGRRRPRQSHAPFGTPPLQTHVGLDRPRNTTPNPRWLKALHRLEAVN